jgi:hypothetical protein
MDAHARRSRQIASVLRGGGVAALGTAVAALSGCAASLGGLSTYAPAEPKSAHMGVDLEGHVWLPEEPHFVVGGYAAHLFQIHPGTQSDQGRLAAVVGYSNPPLSQDSSLGFQATLRLGGFRGSNGPLVPLGALAVATVSPMIRLAEGRPGAAKRSPSDVGWVLVPWVSGGVLVPFDDVRVEPELGVGLALRAYLAP